MALQKIRDARKREGPPERRERQSEVEFLCLVVVSFRWVRWLQSVKEDGSIRFSNFFWT